MAGRDCVSADLTSGDLVGAQPPKPAQTPRLGASNHFREPLTTIHWAAR